MARATFKTAPQDIPVVLELTSEEARALRDLLYRHVGGTGKRRTLLTGHGPLYDGDTRVDGTRVDGVGIALTDLLGIPTSMKSDMHGTVMVS